MNTSLIKKWKREIAIVLQTEQYKNVDEIDEELLVQIIGELQDSEAKIEGYIKDSDKLQKNSSTGPFTA